MKKVTIKLFLAFAIMTSIFACSKESAETAPSIKGSWFATSESYREFRNDTLIINEDTTYANNDAKVIEVSDNKIISIAKKVKPDTTYFKRDTASYSTNGSNLILISHYRQNGITKYDTLNCQFTVSKTDFDLKFTIPYTQDRIKYSSTSESKFKRK